MHPVHTDDVAGTLWAGAEWIASLGRKEADSLAGDRRLHASENPAPLGCDGFL